MGLNKSGSVTVAATPNEWIDKKTEEVRQSLIIGQKGFTYATDGRVLFNKGPNTVKYLFALDEDGETILKDTLDWLKEQLDQEEYEQLLSNVTKFLQEMVNVLPPKLLLALAHKIVKKHGGKEEKEQKEQKEAA